MNDKEKTCKDCKYFMVAPTNPFKGTCTVNRKDLPHSLFQASLSVEIIQYVINLKRVAAGKIVLNRHFNLMN